MIKVIWRKELLEQLTSRRFIYCTLIIVSLIWVIGLLRIASHEKARAEKDRITAEIADEFRKIDGYAVLRTKVVRTPSSLEVLDRGVTEKKSSVVPIGIYEIPYATDKHTLSTTDNSLLAIIGSFDVVHVIQVFLSLLAVLLACESISGEKEKGTLSLVLTMNVSRIQIAMGKFLGGITVLNVPIFLGFLGVTIFLFTSEHIQLTMDDWVGLIGIWVTSLFYIAIFYLIGMALSCCTHNTSTSLIYGLSTWTFLVIVLPGSIVFFVNQQYHRQADVQIAKAMQDELWREYQQRVDGLVRTAGMGDEYPPLHLLSMFYGTGGPGNNPSFAIGPIKEDAPLADFLNLLRTGENLRLQYAQKVWNACGPLWESRPRSLIRLNNQLQRITPTGSYLEVIGGLARTDAGVFYDFIDQARQYRKQLLEYLRAHDAFGSKDFFSGQGMQIIKDNKVVDNKGTLDPRTLPTFEERHEFLSLRLGRIAPSILSLFLYAGLMWLAVVGLFSRYDVIR
ncbi:MAG: ABC transporter permease [Gemmatimonadetes bacterium]|nr:ABC transporter permease [Gemmatimonadota bacterium]